MWHGYFAIEDINLNDAQRDTLIDVLRELGPDTHPSPACLNHWRTRLDGDAAIFEALFNEDNISIVAFKNRLGAIFGVDPDSITHAVVYPTFDSLSTAVVTFGRNGTDYLRVAFFGYNGTDWPTWEQSGDECRAYLALYADLWEGE